MRASLGVIFFAVSTLTASAWQKKTGTRTQVAVTFTEEHIGPEFGTFHFIVEDTGIGISKEFLPHIFDPFERENNTTMSGVYGTGLGLPLVHKIITAHGGRISVRSRPAVPAKDGNGSVGGETVFRIWLPLAPEEESGSARR